MVVDDRDPIIDERFEPLRAMEPPDLWPSIATPRAAPRRRSGRPLSVIAACVAVVLAVAATIAVMVARGRTDDVDIVVGNVADTSADTSPETAPSVAEPESSEPPVRGDDALTSALVGAGVDVANAPDDAIVIGGRRVCGLSVRPVIDEPWQEADAAAIRCFLDSHLAGAAGIVVESAPTVEGDPIVTVWRAEADGTVSGWMHSTRDRFGEPGWTYSTCDRVAVVGGADLTISCVSDADPTRLVAEPLPSWFVERSPLPMCGYEVRAIDPSDIGQCFTDAVANRAAAEIAYATHVGDVRSARWFRSSPDGVEVIEQRRGSDGDIAWLRYRCAPVDVGAAPDGELAGLPLLNGTSCLGMVVDEAGREQMPRHEVFVGAAGATVLMPSPSAGAIVTFTAAIASHEGAPFLELVADSVPSGVEFWAVEIDGELRSKSTARAGSTLGIRLTDAQAADGVAVTILAVDAGGVVVASAAD